MPTTTPPGTRLAILADPPEFMLKKTENRRLFRQHLGHPLADGCYNLLDASFAEVEPADAVVPAKPGELPFGITAGIPFQQVDGLIESPQSSQIS